MPTYKVTDPQSGRTVSLTGDSPPTEQELEQVFAQINQQPNQQPQGQPQGMHFGVAGSVPEAQYQQGARNILGNLFDRPAGAVRGALSGTGGAEGFLNPTGIKPPSQVMNDFFKRSLGNVGGSAVSGALMPAGFAADVLTNPTELATLFLGGKPLLKGAEKTGAAVTEATDMSKIAGRVVNSLIKPAQKGFRLGKNPGMGVAKEGLVAGNMEGLLDQVSKRTELIKQAVSTIRGTPENIIKTVDLEDTLQPLKDVYTKLSRDPLTHSNEMKQVLNNIRDLTGQSKGVAINLKNVGVSDAYNLKDRVSKMQNWNVSSEAADNIAKAVRQVYHNIDSKIDTAIPELAELNSRWANLISAKQAISHRINLLQSKEPANWSTLINLPFAVARSTGAKTLLGKLLARSYKIPK